MILSNVPKGRLMATRPLSPPSRLMCTAMLTLVVIASGACGKSTGSTAETKEASAVGAAVSTKDGRDRVVVYYFHFSRRCRTCLGIQKTISDTLKDRFAGELAAGTLVFEEINLDEDQHKHYMKEFELGFSSMIVAARKGDSVVKWVNSDKIWEHAHNAPVLSSYVEEQVISFLATL